MEKENQDDYPLTTKQIASAVGISESMVRRLAQGLESEGLAKRGRPWRFKEEVVDYLKKREKKRPGRKKGKQRKLTEHETEILWRLYDGNFTTEQICELLRISRTTLYAYLNRRE